VAEMLQFMYEATLYDVAYWRRQREMCYAWASWEVWGKNQEYWYKVFWAV